jgi:hypothetical protein
LGEKGDNINDDIGKLVEKGLSPQIQMSMDIVRVVGNNSVHPGELDVRDDQETALKLFALISLIVSEMITRPAEINAFFGGLPQGAREQIAKRDGTAAKP